MTNQLTAFRFRFVLTVLSGVILVVCAYWNIFSSYARNLDDPPPDSNEIVLREQQLAPFRTNLLAAGYRGDIGFLGLRDLAGQPWLFEDDHRWGVSQYVMIPWQMVRGRRDTLFVLVDFETPASVTSLDGYSKFYDDGRGLVLFRAKQQP